MAAINFRSYMLVTGGSGGIGTALCKLLPEIGIVPIIGFNTNLAQATNLAKELNTFSVRIDLRKKESIEESIPTIVKQLKDSDILMGVVLGASSPPDVLSFMHTQSDHLLNQFQINIIGPQLLLKALIKKFFRKKKTGTVIGILSEAIGSDEYLPPSGMSSYIVAKSGLKSMLSVCATEFKWLKVRTVMPSFTRTKMLDVFDSRYLDILDSQKKISTPEEVAKLIIKEIVS